MKEMAYSSDPNADREILDEGYVHGYHYCIVSLGSHPCAYVEIPKDHPCYGLNYEKIKVMPAAYTSNARADFLRRPKAAERRKWAVASDDRLARMEQKRMERGKGGHEQ